MSSFPCYDIGFRFSLWYTWYWTCVQPKGPHHDELGTKLFTKLCTLSGLHVTPGQLAFEGYQSEGHLTPDVIKALLSVGIRRAAAELNQVPTIKNVKMDTQRVVGDYSRLSVINEKIRPEFEWWPDDVIGRADSRNHHLDVELKLQPHIYFQVGKATHALFRKNYPTGEPGLSNHLRGLPLYELWRDQGRLVSGGHYSLSDILAMRTHIHGHPKDPSSIDSQWNSVGWVY